MKITTPPRRSPAAVRDPRTARGFNPQWYPQSDGHAAPTPGADGRHDRIRLEFLAIYHDLNRSQARLLEARRSGGRSLETRALREVEKLLRRRDACEDRHAPIGVIAEAVVRKGFIVDVKFHFGTRPLSPGQAPIYSSAYITIPLPPGVRAD